MKKEKPTEKLELDEKEKEYYAMAVQNLKAAESNLNNAQNLFAKEETAFLGFVRWMIKKYDLPPQSRISPEGEIILPEEK